LPAENPHQRGLAITRNFAQGLINSSELGKIISSREALRKKWEEKWEDRDRRDVERSEKEWNEER
jgi:hypothetical protein